MRFSFGEHKSIDFSIEIDGIELEDIIWQRVKENLMSIDQRLLSSGQLPDEIENFIDDGPDNISIAFDSRSDEKIHSAIVMVTFSYEDDVGSVYLDL